MSIFNKIEKLTFSKMAANIFVETLYLLVYISDKILQEGEYANDWGGSFFENYYPRLLGWVQGDVTYYTSLKISENTSRVRISRREP